MWEYRTFERLPEQGGLNDQPAGLLARMRHAEYIFLAIDSYNRAPNLTKWQAENPHASKVKSAVDRMRKEETPSA